MRLASALGTGVTSWRDVHAALVAHNEPGNPTAGYLFEEFARYFFLTAPEYKGEFKNVWAETEIPTRVRKKLTLAKRDHGVDLLLEDHEGRFHAVQCKFKTDQSKTLGWTADRLSSWLAESDEAQGLIMFTNASGIDKQSTRKAVKKDFTLVTVGDLLSLSPETTESILRLARGKVPKKVKRFKPRPHQRRAINDVVKGFKAHDRGQLILPCGAGKTLAALWLKERLGAKRTLVLVPSLALLRQIRREWAAQQKERLPYLCVCSEKDIDKDKRDVIVTHTFEVPGHVTTQPNEIAAFARKHRELVVYSTYQSLEAVVDAGVKFDLAICDEAHKTATARHNEFALVHDDALKADKRLYMTATPRVLSPIAKGKLGEDAFDVVADMSDEETFGPEFHRMSFADAIEQGILVDYKIVVVGVSDGEVHKHIVKRTYLEDASADQVATSLALAKVMKKHGLAHGLTFHSNVKRAKSFSALHKKRTRKTEVGHVNGSMSTNDRLVLLDEFKEAPHAVMTNARCLTEGVDVPAIDCVAFVDPKHSKIDIVQAAGRALRLGGDDKDYGVILIPVFYEVGEDPEEIASTGIFKNVFEVVRAMADQDERLQAEIMNIKFGEGEKPVVNPRVQVDIGDDKRLILTGFEKQLKAALVERVVERTHGSFEFWFQCFREFVAANGHGMVPYDKDGGLWRWVARTRQFPQRLSDQQRKALTDAGFVWNQYEAVWEEQFAELVAYRKEHGAFPQSGDSLARWVFKQRSNFKKGTLAPERVQRLKAIGFDLEGRKGLSREAVLDIFHSKETAAEMAARHGISEGAAHHIRQGWTYSEITGKKFKKTRGRKPLSAEAVIDIFTNTQLTGVELAKKYGVVKTTVSNIQTRRAYRSITGGLERKAHRVPEAEVAKQLGTTRYWLAKKYSVLEGAELPVRADNLGVFYEEGAVDRIRKHLAITLANTQGLYTKNDFRKHGVPWTFVERLLNSGEIVPEGTGLRGTAGVVKLYSKKSIDLAKRIYAEHEAQLASHLTTGQLAEAIGKKKHNIKQLVQRGDLKPKRNRLGQLLFTQRDLERVRRNPDKFFPGGARGERARSKLSRQQALAVYRAKGTQVEIARRYGISNVQVSNIKQGKSWAHVTGAKSRAGKKRLAPEKVLAIYRDPGSYREIAEEYGIHRESVGNIKNGKTWAHVTGHKTGAAE